MGILDTLLSDLPLTRGELELLVLTAPARYKVHLIDKRHGRGKRTIAQPTAEIKLLQRLMIERILDQLPISKSAMAYREGRSIADHATPHAHNKYLLKLDFENFFPSITAVDFLKHINRFTGLSREDAKFLARLFFWRPKGTRNLILSIGAPSSPSISNTLMYGFDQSLEEFCAPRGITYTRYADDLALSTNQPNVLKEAHLFVGELCKTLPYPKLRLNEEKTVYTSKKHRRFLTGLVLSNDGKASLGREKKRLIRSMLAHCKNGELPDDERGRLRGWIAYAMSVDKPFISALKRMVGDDFFNEFMNQ